jgi:hypothetical protein
LGKEVQLAAHYEYEQAGFVGRQQATESGEWLDWRGFSRFLANQTGRIEGYLGDFGDFKKRFTSLYYCYIRLNAIISFYRVKTIMRQHRAWILLLLSAICLVPAGRGQEATVVEGTRKIIHRTNPLYPEIAKKMGLTGVVKAFAIVSPDGKVKTVEPMGGSPVLVQAAQSAIYQWKFAPGNAETRELIELHFSPTQ